MKRAFRCSFCYQGLRGGAIYLDDTSVAYRNQTLTLPEAYKNIVIPIQKIESVEKGHIFLFPTVTIHLENQEAYRFVLFRRQKFLDCLTQLTKK